MFESYWMKILFVIGVCSASFIIQYIVNIILKKMDSRFQNEFLPFIQRLLGIGIWCVGLAVILFEFGVINIMNLVTTAGIGSILIAMLIKDSVSNIVAGMTLMFDRPFRVGDKIKLSTGDAGEVIKIGLRRTQILIPKTEGVIVVLFWAIALIESLIFFFTLGFLNISRSNSPVRSNILQRPRAAAGVTDRGRLK